MSGSSYKTDLRLSDCFREKICRKRNRPCPTFLISVEIIPSALRELEEELGIIVEPDELIDCGLFRLFTSKSFHGGQFVDNQIAKVFLLWKDVEAEQLVLQEEEIESVKWFDFEECKTHVKYRTIPHCIAE